MSDAYYRAAAVSCGVLAVRCYVPNPYGATGVCGKRVGGYWVPTKALCEECRATKEYQDDLIAFDIGFAGNKEDWYDHIDARYRAESA